MAGCMLFSTIFTIHHFPPYVAIDDCFDVSCSMAAISVMWAGQPIVELMQSRVVDFVTVCYANTYLAFI